MFIGEVVSVNADEKVNGVSYLMDNYIKNVLIKNKLK